MLAIGIRYLTGYVVASEPDNRDRVEWPPHPGRVFMALAAAHFQTGADAEERRALLYLEDLEQKEAPSIWASDAMPQTPVTHFVPVNDKAGPSKTILQSISLTRDRQPRTFARAWLESDTVFFMWPHADMDASTRTALGALCAKVTRIGHSSSLVQVWLAESDEIVQPNWEPDEDRATIRLRVASPGTLVDLERRFNGDEVTTYATLKAAEFDDSDMKVQKAAKVRLKKEFPEARPPTQFRPRLPLSRGYARATSQSQATSITGTIFSPQLLVFRLDPDASPYSYLDLQSVLTLTQRWRKALLSRSNDLPCSVRAILSGHEADGSPLKRPHLAFLPLAFVGHEHADGRILGAGLALPEGLSRDDRRGVLLALDRVHQLLLGRMGTWRVQMETSGSPLRNLCSEVWTANPEGAKQWSTVTPVAFDSHPKGKERSVYHEQVTTMIRQACTHIGLPEPREVIMTPVSAHLGVPPVHAFPHLRRKDNSERQHSHAILVFNQAVRGPISIGAGRYHGYGFFRPIYDSPLGGRAP